MKKENGITHEEKKQRRKKRLVISLVSVAVSIGVIIGGFGIYVSDYYHALPQVESVFAPSDDVERVILEDDTIVYIPEEPVAGFIFYPGGKVEYTAYAPLMKECAERGILCVLLRMPFNLAVFDMNAADGIQEKYPEIDKWYIGGHSLGGAMAASYLGDNKSEFEGLVLLAAYSTADLTSGTEVLSLYGSEDKVLNMEKYAESKSNLPRDFSEVIIDGGCHAYFGIYGAQDGDGTPKISNEEQIKITVCEIEKFIKA